jgi:endo-1,4-beta-xylanase
MSIITRNTFLKTCRLLGKTVFFPSKLLLNTYHLDTIGRPLRDIAMFIYDPFGNPFKIGVFLEPGDLEDPDGIPLQSANRQFNLRVNLSISMFDSYRGINEWDFSMADQELEQAQSANQSTLAAQFVWGSEIIEWATPDWIRNGGYNREQLITILENHIETVMTRYRGKINAYIVTNEAFTGGSPNGSGQDDWWWTNLGIDYITIAFQKARQIDSSATLIYNHHDNHLIGTPNYIVTKQHIESLNSQGLVDAVGCQLHLADNRPPKEDVIAALQSFGIPVWITEFDSFQLSESQTEDPEEEQAEITKQMIEAALESNVCDHFVTWGFSDRNSWWGNEKKPCLWDSDYQAKPNYYAIQKALLDKAPTIFDLFLPFISN